MSKWQLCRSTNNSEHLYTPTIWQSNTFFVYQQVPDYVDSTVYGNEDADFRFWLAHHDVSITLYRDTHSVPFYMELICRIIIEL